MPYVAPLWVGIDWATQNHQVCVLDGSGARIAERGVRHHPGELDEFCAWLAQLASESECSVYVAIEVPHGAVVDVLLNRGFAVYAINPKQLSRFRDRFSPSGAKDDRRDALVLADSLRTDTKAFRLVRPDSAWAIELREYCRMHEDLVQERTRLTNRMREQLRRYFPAFLECFPDPSEPTALDLWRLVPSPAAAGKVKAKKVAEVLAAHRIRRLQAEETLAKLREASFILAPGTVEAAIAHTRMLVQRLSLIESQLSLVDGELDQRLEQGDPESAEEEGEQRDAAILRSVPGVGRYVCATLLAEARRLLRDGDYHALRVRTGVAPVTKRSGQKLFVRMRASCNRSLRNAVYHWTRVAVQHDLQLAASYAALRERMTHARALRTIADRLLRVICAMMRSRTMWKPTNQTGESAA